MSSSVRIASVGLLLLATPLLQGAGCKTHYSAHLKGSVVAAEDTQAEQIRILYRRRGDDVKVCQGDWAPCLKEVGWYPLQKCERQTDPIVAGAPGRQHDFAACTAMIGTDYVADLVAFIDADGDGVLDPGEKYGLWKGNPITRDRETQLTFEIDQVLP